MRVFIIVGTRPNFIKVVPLLQVLMKSKTLKPILVNTGQHYDTEMADIFFKELKICKPGFDLEVKSSSTDKILNSLEKLFNKERPDIVAVLGDVNSTLAAALAASRLHIPIAHIEAGLRSYNKSMPEEINRVLTDHISDFLFCPTKQAVKNLKKENITKNVYLTGDIMLDTLKCMSPVAEKKSSILEKIGLKISKYYLLTIHRAENTDDPDKLRNILSALLGSDLPIVFPIHPRTKKVLQKLPADLKRRILKKLFIIPPVSYLDMLILEKNAKKILTDSGGVQKEAYLLKVPCITLRNETEWVETVEDHWNILVGHNSNLIKKAIKDFFPKSKQKNHYGKGDAAKKIVKVLHSI